MTTVTMRRMFGVEPSALWNAFTDPGAVAAWFWPERFETAVELDVHTGGRWRVSSEPQGMAASGEYLAVEEERRLTFGWRWDGESEETVVAVTLTPAASGGTELEVEHTGFADSESALEHEAGWNDCLDRLELRLG